MAVILMLFLILHLGAGLILPYRAGFKPYFYKLIEDSGLDLERRLNREKYPQSVRIFRGLTVGLAMGLLGILTGAVIYYASHHLPYGTVLQFAFIACCINFMTPLKVVRQIEKLLQSGQPTQAIAALQPYFQEPLEEMDTHAIIRKTIEFIALSLNNFLLAPSFWFLVWGPVGLAAYMTFSALQHAFGVPDPRRRYFSSFVRIVDTLLNIPPAILTAFFLTAGALFVSRSNPVRAVTTILQQSRRQHFLYQGWIMTAIAGGLGVTLGGPVRYSPGFTQGHPWVGPPETSARVTLDDLARAALIQYVFFMCVIAMVAAFLIIGFALF